MSMSVRQRLDGCAEPARAVAARRSLPGRAQTEQASALFRLLGEPGRARMLYALAGAKELCVGDLARVVDMAESSVSQALRLLRAAGIVCSRRSGRHIYYRLEDDHVRELLEVMRKHVSHPRRRRSRDQATT